MDSAKKEQILTGLTVFLDEATNVLLEGSSSADVKKWRNRLVILPQLIRDGKVQDPKEVERYIKVALKSALMSEKLEHQKDMILNFAKVISNILKTVFMTM